MLTRNSLSLGNAHHKPVFCLFGYRATLTPFSKPLLVRAMFALLVTLPLVGCGFGQSKDKSSAQDKYAKEGPGVFSDQWDQNRPINIPATDDSLNWSIILVALPSQQVAQQVLSNVQSQYGLLNAYIMDRQGKTMIAYGQYPGPNNPQALLDLDRIRQIQNAQSKPFAGAYLAPPSAKSLAGSNTEHDLRLVKEKFGPTALYTLQIGVYGTMDRSTPKPNEIKEFRAAAEQAVAELRSQGQRAFYYHAPMNSMVTIGVFGTRDFDNSTTPPMESMRLKKLRKQYPHNYLNGQGIKETVLSETGQRITRLQASSLVAIPEK